MKVLVECQRPKSSEKIKPSKMARFVFKTIYLTIILRNRAEYRLIRRPRRLKSDDIPQD